MSNHTPGEWVVVYLGEALSIRSPARRNVVASIRLGNNRVTQAADAVLISAAPDMLAALKKILATVNSVTGDIADIDRLQIERAVAKAEDTYLPWGTDHG